MEDYKKAGLAVFESSIEQFPYYRCTYLIVLAVTYSASLSGFRPGWLGLLLHTVEVVSMPGGQH